jgi:diaminopimelate epimerase
MQERIFKYHGLGNDFVILDRRQTGEDIAAEQARLLCDRRRGIGADGVLCLLPSAKAAARMVVHNADGSVAEMCGNGVRCAVKYLVDHDGGGHPERLAVETGAGVLQGAVSYAGKEVFEVEVDMGPARLVAEHLPSFQSGIPFVSQPIPSHPGLRGTAVSMGNPHLVVFGITAERASVLGPELECAPGFDKCTNVEFCELRSDGLNVVVWERGVGLTQACGTGACAAAAASVHQGLLPAGQWLRVRLPGGDLQLWVAPGLSQVRMRGPATFVFEGTLPPLAIQA